MLLRLLPIPTPSSPAPPTILFTLPLPTHPYTSRGLPLPPNLLAHRSVCLQEDLDCPNVLLGEKSSWISGIVDDVTFSLPAKSITVLLIDGTILTVPISPECTRQLRLVIHEVQMSFAPPEPSPRSSASAPVSPTTRTRSPSALLLSILSPLLNVNNTPSPVASSLPTLPPQPPARIHRRQARSLLVDTYRTHVLPLLRERLPSAYLPWAIASETARKMEEFERIKADTDAMIIASGVVYASATPMKRMRSASTTSSATESDSDDDTMSPITPATSVFSPSGCATPPTRRGPPTPQSYLLSIPPAHSIPIAHRNAYSAHLARLSKIASRISAIKKLQGRYEREEGKRQWLEGLERGRQGDKALRRAFSNGQIKLTSTINANPTKRSHLWRSFTSVEEVREPLHPVMMPPSPVSEASEPDEVSEIDATVRLSLPLIAPPIPPRRRSAGSLNLPNLPDLTLEDSKEEVADKLIIVQHTPVQRPPMPHRSAHDDSVPILLPSRSDESLVESEEWDNDEEVEETRIERVTQKTTPIRWELDTLSMGKSGKNVINWESSLHRDDIDPHVRVEVYNGVEVHYA